MARVSDGLALVLVILGMTANGGLVHSKPIVEGDCLTSCNKYNSTLRATFFFGAVATPLGYKRVTALCPGCPAPQPCKRIPAPPTFYDPRAPTFTCCAHFRVVTGSPFFQTSVEVAYAAAVAVARLTVHRRGGRDVHISCIEPPRDNPFRRILFDSPVVIPVGDPAGVNYTRIDKVEACYDEV